MYRGLQEQGSLKLHQLWFLKHRDAASEQERVKKEVLAATNALEERMAELRHGEAELETIRQAHYTASDELHDVQGSLAEAALEVSRLEERIRYVVEGRQRIEQRMLELKTQSEQWGERQTQAQDELEHIAEQIAAADEQSEVLTAQAEEQAGNLPTAEDAVRAAQARSSEQRNVGRECAAADSRAGRGEPQYRRSAPSVERATRPARCRAPPVGRARHGPARRNSIPSSPVAEEAHVVTDARLHELTDQVPALDEETSRQARAGECRNRASKATSARGLKPCAPCKRRCRPKAS